MWLMNCVNIMETLSKRSIHQDALVKPALVIAILSTDATNALGALCIKQNVSCGSLLQLSMFVLPVQSAITSS